VTIEASSGRHLPRSGGQIGKKRSQERSFPERRSRKVTCASGLPNALDWNVGNRQLLPVHLSHIGENKKAMIIGGQQ
jgi:hypothetical protein